MTSCFANTMSGIDNMKISIRDVKQTARETLLGNWSDHLSYSLGLLALEMICVYVVGMFNETGFMASLFSIVIAAILQLLLGLFYAGALQHFLKSVRGESGSIQDFIMPFRSQPDRFLIVGLITLAAGFVIFSPIFFSGLFASPSAAGAVWFRFIWMLIGIILYSAVRLSLSMSVFLLLEDPSKGAIESVRESMDLMKGHKMQLFLLFLSFIGYGLLALLTLGAALLWIIPYMMTSLAVFYEKRSLSCKDRDRFQAL